MKSRFTMACFDGALRSASVACLRTFLRALAFLMPFFTAAPWRLLHCFRMPSTMAPLRHHPPSASELRLQKGAKCSQRLPSVNRWIHRREIIKNPIN